jgi:hypothetical protein
VRPCCDAPPEASLWLLRLTLVHQLSCAKPAEISAAIIEGWLESVDERLPSAAGIIEHPG